MAVYKTATESTFTVTFEIEGKSSITQKADSLAIPDTTREGFNFQGWVVKGGSSAYVDPLTYEITADVTFVAVYKAMEVIEHTVTFVNGEKVIGTVKVVDGTTISAIDAPEGLFWLFDFTTPITADITIEAKPIAVTVQFQVGDKVYSAYTQTIPYGEKVDVKALSDFVFPEGYDGWDADLTAPVYIDTIILAKAIPEPVKEPSYWATPTGQCTLILVIFLVGALIAVAYTKGLIRIPKLGRSKAPVVEEKPTESVEKPQEEKK